MNTKIAILAAFGAGCIVGSIVSGRRYAEAPRFEIVKVRDTIVVERPVQVRTVYLHPDTVFLPAAEGRDSCRVLVSLEQTEYSGPGYRAYVSGYRSSLDSLMLERSLTTVRPIQKQSRFTLGLQAGYGLTPRGLQPYIGLGLTCTIGF